MTTILIGDKVKAKPSPGFTFNDQTGEVTATRKATDGTIEHLVVFPPRSYTQEEMDRGDDTFPEDNQSWLRADEVVKGK